MKRLTNNKKLHIEEPVSRIVDVGVDLGYGFIKAVTSTSAVVFPSVAAYATDLGFQQAEITVKYAGDQISDEDGDWFVGALAQAFTNPGEQLTLKGRTADEATQGNVFRLRMMKAALGKLFPNQRNGDVIHVRIATGLPVDHMEDAPDLKSALLGQHAIKTDNTNFIANVTQVMVMPQGYGSLYAQMLTPAGEDDPCFTYHLTAVIDVGTYTVDLAVDRDGEYVRSRSGSRESGVYFAEQRIGKAYEQQYRRKLQDDEIREIMKTGCIRVRNQPINFSDVVSESVDPLKAATLNLLEQRLGVGDDIDVVYLVGGGAGLIESAVRSKYPQTVLAENAQFANATGYLRYALSTLID